MSSARRTAVVCAPAGPPTDARIACDSTSRSTPWASPTANPRRAPQRPRTTAGGDELDDRAGAEAAARDHLTEVREHGCDLGDLRCRAYREEGQATGPRAVDGAGHRCVDDHHTCRRPRVQLHEQLDAVGREVHPDRAVAQRREGSGAQHDVADVPRLGQGRQQQVHRAGAGAGVRRRACTERHELVDPLRDAVVHDHVAHGIEQRRHIGAPMVPRPTNPIVMPMTPSPVPCRCAASMCLMMGGTVTVRGPRRQRPCW